MESLQKPVALTQDVVRVLDEICSGADNALYGAGPDVSEELFAKHVASLVEGAGLPVLQTMHYRWYLRELARLWRTRTGRDLAFHLELCIRKWVGLGLEPRTLQFLVTEAHERLKAQSLATKTRNHEEDRPEPEAPGTPGPSSTTKIQRHEENPDRSATKTRNHESGSGPSLAPDPQPQTHICVHLRSSAVEAPASAESVESADAPSPSPIPDPQSLVPAKAPSPSSLAPAELP
jgi:hypothetical protein